MMKRLHTLALAAICVLIGSIAAQAKDYNVTAHAGSRGGLYMETLVVFANLWKEKLPNVKVSPILGGSVGNAMKINSAKPNEAIGIADTYISIIGSSGEGAFKKRAPGGLKNINVLFRYNAPSYTKVLGRRSTLPKGVNTMAELIAAKPGLRWAFHERGNVGQIMGQLTIEAYGATLEDLKKWGGSVTFLSHTGMTQLMINGQTDIVMGATRQPAAWMLDMDASVRDLVWLPLADDKIAKIVREAKGGFINKAEPPTAYKSLTKPYPSFADDHILMVPKAMDEELAYALTKTALKYPDVMRKAIAAMKDFGPPASCKGTGAFPMHPGAARACKEMGAK